MASATNLPAPPPDSGGVSPTEAAALDAVPVDLFLSLYPQVRVVPHTAGGAVPLCAQRWVVVHVVQHALQCNPWTVTMGLIGVSEDAHHKWMRMGRDVLNMVLEEDAAQVTITTYQAAYAEYLCQATRARALGLQGLISRVRQAGESAKVSRERERALKADMWLLSKLDPANFGNSLKLDAKVEATHTHQPLDSDALAKLDASEAAQAYHDLRKRIAKE